MIEAGRLYILSKEGALGSSLTISEDILFGRDIGCAIRIKVPAVSRQHAVIKVNTGGYCELHHLSSSNPTILNGAEVSNLVCLKNRDVITIGGRNFLFQSGNSSSSSHTYQYYSC
jgi:antigen KI-67